VQRTRLVTEAYFAKVDFFHDFAHRLKLIGLLQTLAKETHLLLPVSLLKSARSAPHLAVSTSPPMLYTASVLGEQFCTAAKLMCMYNAGGELP